jgi:hypothetical protein
LLNHSVLRGRKRLGHPSRHVARRFGWGETVGHISHGFYIHNWLQPGQQSSWVC